MTITVHDKVFKPFISEEEIRIRVRALSEQLSEDYAGRKPLFLGVLNGSFIFAADLFRHLTVEAEISFVKLASYKGTSSTGSVVTAIGLEESLHDRHVVVVEDIIDTGRTMHHFLAELCRHGPASIRVATFLNKPDALEMPDVKADYVGFEIPKAFVLGYGLDYDGLGRNLPQLYTLAE